jgi:hypothetical protein
MIIDVATDYAVDVRAARNPLDAVAPRAYRRA